MCGIAGIARQGAAVPEATLWRMADSLRHRGPDDSGVYADGGLGLAHTRLAILDLSPNGRQPMASADGRFVLAYNGEAYNYRDLRRELAASGHRFRGESDTEVVLAALTRWGHAALARLEGMFALALWDGRRRRLLLARDRFGVKPLYYCVNDGALAFGSEIKALLASGEVEPSVDWAGLCEVVHYNAALGERTTFAGVRKLLPGQKLTWEGGGAALATFACVHDVAPARDDFASAVAKTRRLLSRAVESHLASDVDVGVFLSGGMDSSAIVAFASRHRPLRTYAAGFDVDADERPMARQVAERFGTEHHEVSVAGANVPSVIERLVAVFDAPSGDAANIPLFLLAEQLEGDVKVILQGDGGDEMFGGYPRYALLARERWLHACGLMAPLALALAPAGGRWRRRLATLRHMRHPDPAMRLALLMAETGADADPLAVFQGEARAALATTDPFDRYRLHYGRLRRLDAVQRALYADASILLPDVYFEKVDRAAMAHGVEVRVPFVDAQLAAYAMALPSRFKVRGFEKKRVLRRALRGIVPDAVLNRPKAGFGVPMRRWLRTSLADYLREVLLDEGLRRAGVFDAAAVERRIGEHVAGLGNHDKLLYKLLQIALWLRRYRPRL